MSDPGSSSDVVLESSTGRLIVATTVLGSALAMLTSTVVNVALPVLAVDLDASTSEQQWVINAYLLTLASLIVVGGGLGDRWGRVRVYRWGVVLFTGASVACAVAPHIEALVGFRLLQGIGAALLTPGSLAILEATLRPEDRGPRHWPVVGAGWHRRCHWAAGGRGSGAVVLALGLPAQPPARRGGVDHVACDPGDARSDRERSAARRGGRGAHGGRAWRGVVRPDPGALHRLGAARHRRDRRLWGGAVGAHRRGARKTHMRSFHWICLPIGPSSAPTCSPSWSMRGWASSSSCSRFQLQVGAGWSPLAAGASMLPVTGVDDGLVASSCGVGFPSRAQRSADPRTPDYGRWHAVDGSGGRRGHLPR